MEKAEKPPIRFIILSNGRRTKNVASRYATFADAKRDLEKRGWQIVSKEF